MQVFRFSENLKPVFYEWAWGANWAGEPRGCPGAGRPVFRSARFGQLELGVGRSLPPSACWGRIRGKGSLFLHPARAIPAQAQPDVRGGSHRSEERRVGKE